MVTFYRTVNYSLKKTHYLNDGPTNLSFFVSQAGTGCAEEETGSALFTYFRTCCRVLALPDTHQIQVHDLYQLGESCGAF